MPRPLVHLLSLALLIPATTPAATADDQSAFFEKHIRPALIKHCYECHSLEAGKQKGGLLLDSKSGWQSGGDTGPAIVPGNAGDSLFIEAVRYHNADLEMPPDGRLPQGLIARFEQWINEGAHDPRGGDATHDPADDSINLEKGRQFWSFQPITQPQPPTVELVIPNAPLTPVDTFILARLQADQITPAPDASPDILLRRLHLDLTGLPPTPEELITFRSTYNKHPASSIEERVDTLLARPEFGERWGRHWLDITRYADSSGGGRAIPLPDAWRYRDYVIQAFNEDRPIDRLIREHIAGDLLPCQSREEQIRNLIATGFLVLGPHNYENQDKELLDLEIADEQIDTIGRAFLGMTIGCARCHDHKFDPIPAEDYYALAGIFTSTASVTHSNVSKWNTAPLPPTPEQAAAITAAEANLRPLETQLKQVKADLAKLGIGAGGMDKAVPASALEGIILDSSQAELHGEWEPSIHSPRFVGDGYIHDQRKEKGIKSVTWRPNLESPGTYEIRLSYSPGPSRSAKVPVTVAHANGRDQILINQKINPDHDQLFQSLGKFSFTPGDQNFIRISTESTEDGHVIADAIQLLPTGKDTSIKPAPAPDKTPNPSRDQIAALENARKSIEKQIADAKKAAPNLPTAMCAAEAEQPADTQLRIRGETRNFGPVVPRGFLQVTRPANAPPLPIATGSGRRELAEWITSPGNPLTARVLVNRIWLHLFGEGIVPTPDNFGITGQPPSHPELLDYLAHSFTENNWSTKQLIRQIVLSRAYRMSSAHHDPAALALDPENRLLWRAHRRSAGAEILRDTMLLLAGRLDPARGGPSLPPDFKSEFGYEFTTLKRSVYVPVFRNTLYEMFATFDFANPNFTVGKRADSTIPTQNLFLLNSPFVHEQAEAAARQLLSLPAKNDTARIHLAWQRTLARDPHPQEFALASNLLDTHHNNPLAAWTTLHRTLFASLDFRYIE